MTEEFFFRGFFYRALRTRMAVWAAALIDAIILPVIAVFGWGLCLLYERTGSLLAVIAIHAALNTVAMLAVEPVPALVVGAMVIAACAVLPRLAGAHPSPLPA